MMYVQLVIFWDNNIKLGLGKILEDAFLFARFLQSMSTKSYKINVCPLYTYTIVSTTKHATHKKQNKSLKGLCKFIFLFYKI
jgi:hypothetical protein